MTTSRTVTTAHVGPIQLRISSPVANVHIVATPDVTQAEITISTNDVDGPIAQAVQEAQIIPNRLEPHKRPFHTIIPGFVTRDGQPVLSFGVMGGDFQPQGHCQVLMNMLDFGMSPQQAGDQPRIGHDGSSDPAGRYTSGGGVLSLEHGIGAAVKRKLLAMGHRDSGANVALGGYQAIWRRENPRVYLGGSDPRRDGCAIGY
jgi:gamma-glutamyltranspeptidase/glutathione hydrolase